MTFLKPRWTSLLLGIVFGSLAQAQETITDDSYGDSGKDRLKIVSVFDPLPSSGYAPLRVSAINSSSRDQLLRFDINSQIQSYPSSSNHRSRFSLPVPAGSSQSAVFMAPLATDYQDRSSYNNHQMEIVLTAGLTRTYSHSSRIGGGFPAIAISKSLNDKNSAALKEALEKKSSSSSRYGNNDFGSRFTPQDVPEDWLSFSGFDYVMLTDLDWSRLRPGTQTALLQWARLGGNLHLYCEGEKPAHLPADEADYGLGSIETFAWDGKNLNATQIVSRYWGRNERVKQIMDEHSDGSKWTLLQALGDRSFNSWQVVIFLGIFAILVGPVNLFVLAPSGRRHRLFYTTPLLSLGASLVMVGIILLQDGIGGKGTRFVFVEIEPKEAAAYVTQKQVSRTGVLTGASFESKSPALIEPLIMPDTSWVKLKKGYNTQSVSLTQNGASREGNFFQSRAEQAQMLHTVVSTRARIELHPSSNPNDGPTLVSALGFTLKELYYCDGEKQFWKLKSPLATGQKADLQKVDLKEMENWWNEKVKFQKVEGLNRLKYKPQNYFFAAAESAPDFTVETLTSIHWQDDVLVYGNITPP